MIDLLVRTSGAYSESVPPFGRTSMARILGPVNPSAAGRTRSVGFDARGFHDALPLFEVDADARGEFLRGAPERFHALIGEALEQRGVAQRLVEFFVEP